MPFFYSTGTLTYLIKSPSIHGQMQVAMWLEIFIIKKPIYPYVVGRTRDNKLLFLNYFPRTEDSKLSFIKIT